MSSPLPSSRSAVLLVEDDEPIRELIEFHLGLAGLDCTGVVDGKEALRMGGLRPFDLILLDLSVPSVDGLTLCRSFRREGPNREVPILILTARREEADKILGLDSGADDYVTKPFAVRELLARINALLRRPRSTWRVQPSPADDVAPITQLGVTIDPARRRVVCDGQIVVLTPHEFNLLLLLASRPGIVFSREALHRSVWPEDVNVTLRGVDTLVKRLRRKVERDASEPERVITVWGAGYKFGDW